MFISPSEYWRPGMGMTAFVHLLPASGSCRHALCGLCQTTPGIKVEPSFLSAFGQVLQHQERPPRVWAASSEGWRVYSKGRKVLRTDTLPFSLLPSLLPLPLHFPAAESHISPPSPFICYSTSLWPRNNGPSRPRTWTRPLKPFL